MTASGSDSEMWDESQDDRDCCEAGGSRTIEETEGSWSNLSNADDILAMLNTGYNGASETGLSHDNMVLTAQSKWLIIDPSY